MTPPDWVMGSPQFMIAVSAFEGYPLLRLDLLSGRAWIARLVSRRPWLVRKSVGGGFLSLPSFSPPPPLPVLTPVVPPSSVPSPSSSEHSSPPGFRVGGLRLPHPGPLPIRGWGGRVHLPPPVGGRLGGGRQYGDGGRLALPQLRGGRQYGDGGGHVPRGANPPWGR
jgi:hypothetical protein